MVLRCILAVTQAHQDSFLSLTVTWPLGQGPLTLSLILNIGIQEMERCFKNIISALRNFTKLNFFSVMVREYLSLCLKAGFSFNRLTVYVIYSSNHDAFESKRRSINNL